MDLAAKEQERCEPVPQHVSCGRRNQPCRYSFHCTKRKRSACGHWRIARIAQRRTSAARPCFPSSTAEPLHHPLMAIVPCVGSSESQRAAATTVPSTTTTGLVRTNEGVRGRGWL